MTIKEQNVADLAEARPLVRSIVALAIFLRWGGQPVETVIPDYYRMADIFLEQLEKDLAAQ